MRVVLKTKSILNSHIFHSKDLFWLFGCIYLLTSETEQIEAQYLAS